MARSLTKHLREDVILLNDRRIPGSRANIDHIAVSPSGIWVIDAKRYKGKVAVSKPLFGPPKLTIAGRDKSKLVEGLAKQVELVNALTPEIAPGIQVRGSLCFVDADLPMLGRLNFSGFPLLYPRQLAKRINEDGPLGEPEIRAVASELARRFPAA